MREMDALDERVCGGGVLERLNRGKRVCEAEVFAVGGGGG